MKTIYKRILDKGTKTVYTLGVVYTENDAEPQVLILKDKVRTKTLQDIPEKAFDNFIKTMTESEDTIVIDNE